MGEDRFNLGDVVAFADGRCRVCVCDNPPELTCKREPCPGMMKGSPLSNAWQ